MLIELFDLVDSSDGSSEWQVSGRWFKYEENVEGVDHYWGRPHVPFLLLHSMLKLRNSLQKGSDFS